MAKEKEVYTTGFGAPVDNDLNSKTAGSPGPVPGRLLFLWPG